MILVRPRRETILAAFLIGLLALTGPAGARAADAELARLKYNHPGLVADLGVGLWAWPLPMDYDDDGDLDLVVSCPDVPFKGTYLFENPGGDPKHPVFKPPVRLASSIANVQPSYVGDDRKAPTVRLLAPAKELVNFKANRFGKSVTIYPTANLLGPSAKLRANQWKLADYDGDGKLDLIVGVEDWSDYGWDNAFDPSGRWTRGPLHGRVFLIRNHGDDANPAYDPPAPIEPGGKPVDTFGMPSPNLDDFDGDGDLDLICGEFLDRFTYFENVGTRTSPRYAPGKRLLDGSGREIAMNLQMIVPVAIDWDRDGDIDLVVGDEDGRVALVEHSGTIKDGLPRFLPPVYFRQQADDLKFGALATPSACDWDGDGDDDLICGDSAGNLGWIENLGGDPPRWAAPVLLEAGGEVIRIMAGFNGSIQGPAEAKWGYTQPCASDWDGDGLPDIVVNSIWGKVVWHRNIGSRSKPRLAPAAPLEVEWAGPAPRPSWNWWNPADNELATEWRTTPCVHDWNRDGLADLLMLDHEGFLSLFERSKTDDGALKLKPGRRVFRIENHSEFDSRHRPLNKESGLLRLNAGTAGASGRRTFCVVDWNQDGRTDLMVDSQNATLLLNLGTDADGLTTFRDQGPVSSRTLAGHSTCPTAVDFDRNGVPDLVIGAEDGRFYYLKNPQISPASSR